jgi:hypothetical protein
MKTILSGLTVTNDVWKIYSLMMQNALCCSFTWKHWFSILSITFVSKYLLYISEFYLINSEPPFWVFLLQFVPKPHCWLIVLVGMQSKIVFFQPIRIQEFYHVKIIRMFFMQLGSSILQRVSWTFFFLFKIDATN